MYYHSTCYYTLQLVESVELPYFTAALGHVQYRAITPGDIFSVSIRDHWEYVIPYKL